MGILLILLSMLSSNYLPRCMGGWGERTGIMLTQPKWKLKMSLELSLTVGKVFFVFFVLPEIFCPVHLLYTTLFVYGGKAPVKYFNSESA